MLNHNRHFIRSIAYGVTETVLSDSHAAWRPADGQIVYLLHNEPWRVFETILCGDGQLVVRVEPFIAPLAEPACPLSPK